MERARASACEFLSIAAVSVPCDPVRQIGSAMQMTRIAILGNAAGGKSTLARQLAEKRGLPYFEIDSLYWQQDWSVVPGDIYERKHAEIVRQAEWIVDGGGNVASVRDRVERATEIILVDMPLWVHFWLAAERQIAWSNGTIRNPPAGIRDMPPTGRLFEIIWTIDREWLPELRALCDAQAAKGKIVTRLNSIDDLNAFASSHGLSFASASAEAGE